jgi:hypothetical protein
MLNKSKLVFRFVVVFLVASVQLPVVLGETETLTWGDGEDMGHVKMVTDETWSDIVSKTAEDRRFLAFFFAPWYVLYIYLYAHIHTYTHTHTYL